MAIITINAVVHIPADGRVIEIGRVVAPMANGALEDRIVPGGADGTRMTNGADAACSIAAVSDTEPGVSERRPQPTGRVVARHTVGCD